MDRENNFLFLEIGDGLPLSIVKKLIKEYKVKNAYATVHDKNIDKNIFSEDPIYIWDAFYGKYPISEEVTPVDRSYENPISEYSVEIIHQMSRHGNWNFEKRVLLYYTHLKYWDNFLETRRINYVIFSFVPHETYNFIIYLLCKEKKIKICLNYFDGNKALLTSNAYYMLNSIEDHTREVRIRFENLKKEYYNIKEKEIMLSKYTEQLIEEAKRRFQMADNSNLQLMNKMRIEDVKHYYSDPQMVLEQLGIRSLKAVISSYVQYKLGIQKTKKLIKKYEEISIEPNFSDKYFYYALHYQPETTSSPLGGIYANQLLAIQLIAHNLPNGYWLYVKEHPAQGAFGREPSYYEELAKIPRVKIISQKTTSEKLMKYAMAVATLTGTVIYESQIIQKPCLCLGYTPLEILDGVYKIDNNRDCKKAINAILTGDVKKTTAKDFRLFLKAMEEISFSKENETEFYQKLLEYIQLD